MIKPDAPAWLAQRCLKNDNGCWLWCGAQCRGYGVFTVYDDRGKRVNKRVHRELYQALVRTLNDAEILHHTCDNRHCCNPAHLEIMTQSEHVKKHADTLDYPCGHPRTEENTVVNSYNTSLCRICRRKLNYNGRKRYLARKRQARTL